MSHTKRQLIKNKIEVVMSRLVGMALKQHIFDDGEIRHGVKKMMAKGGWTPFTLQGMAYPIV